MHFLISFLRITAAFSAAAVAIGAVTKQSVDAYADYEQLAGGVETLFGSGGKSLEEYAASVGKTVDEARGEFNQLMIAEQNVVENAQNALARMEIDELGLDDFDRKMLSTIITNYSGGPVGLDTLAAALGEEAVTIEDVYEPYLIQLGFISKTPRGRIAMPLAYNHLGLSHLLNCCCADNSNGNSDARPTLFDNIE